MVLCEPVAAVYRVSPFQILGERIEPGNQTNCRAVVNSVFGAFGCMVRPQGGELR